MRILAIDTAADFCGLTLHADGQTVDTVIVETQRDQAKILAPLTKALLDKHHLKTSDIDRFAIATGPGSFTGLRVGLSFVRGLALANQKPAVGFDHFEITRHALGAQPLPTLIIRDSKRADLFCAWLINNQLQPYFLSTADGLLTTLPNTPFQITGNGAHYLQQENPSPTYQPLPVIDSKLIQSLAILAETKEHDIHILPQPLYLREADVSFPKKHAAYP
jgi:tRNA threonylcarbamoyladenosine biosynthesis protein TsaB